MLGPCQRNLRSELRSVGECARDPATPFWIVMQDRECGAESELSRETPSIWVSIPGYTFTALRTPLRGLSEHARSPVRGTSVRFAESDRVQVFDRKGLCIQSFCIEIQTNVRSGSGGAGRPEDGRRPSDHGPGHGPDGRAESDHPGRGLDGRGPIDRTAWSSRGRSGPIRPLQRI